MTPHPALPASDCERIAVIGIAQPVNMWTSLAYLVPVGILFAAVLRRRLTAAAMLLGVLLAAEAAGSMLFHGSPASFSQWLHDVAFIAMLGLLAGWHVGRLAGSGSGGERGAWVGGITTAVVAGALHPVTGGFVNVAAVMLVATVAVAEMAARRSGKPAVIRSGLLGVVALAGAAYVLGRTDGPLCSPDSVIQLHGVWHGLTALAAFVWADRALAVRGPAVGSGTGRLIADTLVGTAARALVFAFHRRVDVIGRRLVPRDRPVVLVANHGNGFVDPVVVASALGRLPRFIAKATLWKIFPARIALDAIAVLPVHRHSDGDDPHGNDRTFAATTRALERNDTVAIFPEGTTGDRAHLDRVRSGAARIALGAWRAGVRGVVIVPVGLAFESRVQTRSRASVTFGEPIDLDPWLDAARPDTDDEHAMPAALTEAIRTRLTAVSPVFANVDEREQLRMAAAVACAVDDPGIRPPRFGEVQHRASRLAAAPEPERRMVVHALADHCLRREMVGLTDSDLRGAVLRRSSARLLFAAVVLMLLGPILVTATLVHLPCVIAVNLAVARVDSTATKGTVRLLVGMVTALLTWWVVAVLVADGVVAVVVTMVALAVLGGVALGTWTSVFEGLSIVRRWFRSRDRSRLVPGLLLTQQQLVDAVRLAERAGEEADLSLAARSAPGHGASKTTG
jgi:glycerol-3-phosphate O-acyltransferase / dihydroxyacetone phosphate acyltransferase